MANLNKVMLIGKLTRDPELRYIPSGASIAEFGIAVNRTWKDKSGNKQDEVTFVDVTAWGRHAELANQYLAKGRSVFIDGRLKLDQWTTQDGQKRSKISVVIENMQFLDKGNQQGGNGKQADPWGQANGYGGDYGGNINDGPPNDDIPF